MSDTSVFQPKIIAYVCNWCTYLGADLAGTNRLEYPANVRIVRLPCTGRIDFNLIVKAFERGADAVLVSGCHPGDCHYTAGNYHARRRWILFPAIVGNPGNRHPSCAFYVDFSRRRHEVAAGDYGNYGKHQSDWPLHGLSRDCQEC